MRLQVEADMSHHPKIAQNFSLRHSAAGKPPEMSRADRWK